MISSITDETDRGYAIGYWETPAGFFLHPWRWGATIISHQRGYPRPVDGKEGSPMATPADMPRSLQVNTRPERALRCFIAASARTDLATLRHLLEERGVEVVLAHETLAPRLTIAEKVTSLIAECDLVVAILDQDASPANIAFELGYAFALKKKSLILVSPDEQVPSDLTGHFSIRAHPDDADAVAFALDQLLAAPTRQTLPAASSPAAGKPIGALADRLLARLAAVSATSHEQEYERIVLEAIRASDPAVVVDVQQRSSGRPDVAVWADDLESWVGNPLLIEVKARLNGSAAELVRRQLQSYIELSNSRWALVLYGEGPPQEGAAALSSPPVLFMRLDYFLNSLRTGGLADIVRPLRNAAVHRLQGAHGK
jgi:hypothetical protein